MTNYSLSHSPTGALTFFDSETGEYLHRFFGPEHESRVLYAEGCRILHRTGELCICDLGLGAGFNVMAALRHIELNEKLSGVRIFSFDTTLNGLKLLAEHIARFESFTSYESLVKEAFATFERGDAENPKTLCFRLKNKLEVEWNFYLGDARVNIQKIAASICFHAVFFDFFSCQKTEELWLRASFELFAAKLAHDGILATYSTATPVRAILLSLGLFVGEGPMVSNALKSTLASPDLKSLSQALDQRWRQRFSRSQRKFFAKESPENKEQIETNVMQHPQFQDETRPPSTG